MRNNKRPIKDPKCSEESPQQKSKLRFTKQCNNSPVTPKCSQTPPMQCSTPKSQASDDSLSQDFESNSPVAEVRWKWCVSPTTRKAKAEVRAKCEKMSKRLAKEIYEKNKNEKLQQTLEQKETAKKPEPKLSGLEKFKLEIRRLGLEDDSNSSPKRFSTFKKQKENVTRSFTFGLSDDEDTPGPQFKLDFLQNKAEPNMSNCSTSSVTKPSDDISWRRTKSAHDFGTKSIIEAPQKDLFDDSISDNILLQCSQQLEKNINGKVTTQKEQETTSQFENDSFDELIGSFPLEELEKQALKTEKSTNLKCFPRFNSMPQTLSSESGKTLHKTSSDTQYSSLSNPTSSNSQNKGIKRPCTQEEIEQKRQNAIRIRQERMNKRLRIT